MNNLIRIMMVLLLSVYAHAFSQGEIAQMVAKNPALLDSPQAKAYIASHKGASTAAKKSAHNVPKVTNNIGTTVIMDDSAPVETKKTDENHLIHKAKVETVDKHSL